MMYNVEIWADIKGYEGLYKVSTRGRVMSLPRLSWNGSVYFMTKERLLSPNKDKEGYLSVQLCKQGDKKRYKIHRIVCDTFLPYDETRREVDHIDSNPGNNDITNLRWVNHSENCIHSYREGNRIYTEKMREASRNNIMKYHKERNKLRNK